jgi:regulator of sirC expression with transglutaminase-like and TPR domain
MSLPAAIKAPGTPSEREQSALIRLLGDEDWTVYQAVRERILSCGKSSAGWLRPHTLSSDPVLRRRAQEILKHLAREIADDRFLMFCLTEGNDLNLEQGTWLLAQTQHPDINVEAYQALFDHFAGELRERVDPRAAADQIIASLNEYVFDVLRFHGDDAHRNDPASSYLNRVVDRRAGNPINMCVVYLLLARRLKLPMAGIGLPGHFLCRFQSSSEEYYIDVFNKGKLWTKATCVQYLLARDYAVQDEHLAPVSSRRMLARICAILHQIYESVDMKREATRVQRYLVALTK